MQFRVGGIYFPNSPEFVVSLLALNSAGKVVVPLSCRLKGESLYRKIQYADIQLLITDNNGYAEILKTGLKTDIKMLLVMNDFSNYRVYVNGECGQPAVALEPDIFGIFFTGATTSRPKGVVLSNAGTVKNVLAFNSALGLTAEDCFLLARPLPQAGPVICDLLVAIDSGARLAFLSDIIHPGLLLATVNEYRPTVTYLVRIMLAQLLSYPRFDPQKLDSLRKIVLGSISIPHSLCCRTLEMLPCIALYIIYGLSEAGVRVTTLQPGQILKYPGSAGRPLPGCRVTVYTEAGRVARPMEEGEIYVKTESIMEGYYKNPELTSAVLTSRGLKTGDCGYMDSDGNLYVSRRLDDMIIQGRCNIYPAEIEEILLQHPAVAEVSVISTEDDKLGEKTAAMVRLKEFDKSARVELLQWCRRNMEDNRVPKEIIFVDSIPRNDMGKINRRELKEFYALKKKEQAAFT